MTNQHTPPEERFWDRVMPEPNSGCWLWTGDAPDGRGRLTINKKYVYAYRFAYEMLVGPIPDGKIICHRCNVPLCVNPDHLYAGTHSDNTLDSVRAGTHAAIRYPEKAREKMARLAKRNNWSKGARFVRKVSNENLLKLLDRIDNGESVRSIASDLGIRTCSVYAFYHRWKDRRAVLAKVEASDA